MPARTRQGLAGAGVTLGLAAFAALASPRPAAAEARDLVAEAEDHLEALEFERARATIAEAVHAGASGPAELADIYRLSGVIAGSYGDEDGAARAFRRWLALEPEAALEEGVSPRIAEPFERARAEMAGEPAIAIDAYLIDGDRRVAVMAIADPLEMVEGASAHFRTEDGVTRSAREVGDSPYAIDLPLGVRGEVSVALRDRHGNRLGEAEVALDRGRSREAPVGDTEAAPGPPLYARWYMWAGAATGFAGAAAYFGLSARSEERRLAGIIAASEDYEFEEAQAVEARARRSARFASAAGIAAASAGVAALAVFALDFGDDGEGGGSATRAFLSPAPGGGAAGVELSF